MAMQPAEQVRHYLDATAQPRTVALDVLLTPFGIVEPNAGARRSIEDDLARAGVLVTPSLTGVRDGKAEVTVSLAGWGVAAGPLTPAPSAERTKPQVRAARRREPRARPAMRVVAAPWLLVVGAAVTLTAPFLAWYSAQRDGVEVPDLSTGWQWLGTLDVLLVGVAIGAVALVVRGSRLGTPAFVEFAAGGIALFLSAYRVVAPPRDSVRGVLVEVVVQIGPFVAMAGLIGVLAGIWLLLEDCLPGATRLRPPTG